MEWGIIVGDIVYCLRSAPQSGRPYSASDLQDGNTQIRSFETKKDWVTRAPRCCGASLNLSKGRLINAAQPYHRGDVRTAHPLAVLSELQHRQAISRIPVTALVPENGEWRITATQGIAGTPTIKLRIGGALEDGAILAEAAFVPDGSGLDPQVQMDGHFSSTSPADHVPSRPGQASRQDVPRIWAATRRASSLWVPTFSRARRGLDAVLGLAIR